MCQEYANLYSFIERQQKLNQMLARLIKIAEEYNVAVFITNQVMNILWSSQHSNNMLYFEM